ncbi:hypothetical protein Thiowin_03517 [Thiorhodovibrio winogradskyi]|uniref:Uncharacterized protein n=1 Tax=Thiorhodovibrio winogradskyi TaxID=77007 RepID=A0ABZ0SD39_9GAMM|nr:hypothetical protein [Thiorhodovibrio winogradskyi]
MANHQDGVVEPLRAITPEPDDVSLRLRFGSGLALERARRQAVTGDTRGRCGGSRRIDAASIGSIRRPGRFVSASMQTKQLAVRPLPSLLLARASPQPARRERQMNPTWFKTPAMAEITPKGMCAFTTPKYGCCYPCERFFAPHSIRLTVTDNGHAGAAGTGRKAALAPRKSTDDWLQATHATSVGRLWNTAALPVSAEPSRKQAR